MTFAIPTAEVCRLATKLRCPSLRCLCRPKSKHSVSRGAIMSLRRKRERTISNYDECSVLLLSAFFCVTGETAEDAQLRKSIEVALIDLAKARSAASRANVIKFSRRRPLAG